ncbi:hypothetical protein BDV96DRAFT_608014 [Lophiotrema nucula]|uniref:Uncharacterized protein n=1 Tax=Lophiotrema nucula TaxID=690887 RepID=A0A6A5YEK1_9PLEO|nr:hypothetical protein BDV96DRAFT_608014 [Lophiotrema nucula]
MHNSARGSPATPQLGRKRLHSDRLSSSRLAPFTADKPTAASSSISRIYDVLEPIPEETETMDEPAPTSVGKDKTTQGARKCTVTNEVTLPDAHHPVFVFDGQYPPLEYAEAIFVKLRQDLNTLQECDLLSKSFAVLKAYGRLANYLSVWDWIYRLERELEKDFKSVRRTLHILSIRGVVRIQRAVGLLSASEHDQPSDSDQKPKIPSATQLLELLHIDCYCRMITGHILSRAAT